MKNWMSLPLRLGLGVIFIGHGLQKAFGLWGGPGIEGFSKMLAGLQISPALPLAYAVALIELIGGLFLILGILTRVVCIFLSVVMIVALVKVHGPKGLFLAQGGFEYVFLILCACTALFMAGPGKMAVTKKI